MVLLPLAYGALALGLANTSHARRRRGAGCRPCSCRRSSRLIGFNVGGQVKEGVRLHQTRGVGLYSDAINRLAADLDAAPRKPFVYFPDWGLQMPVALLTGGRVGLDSVENLAGGAAEAVLGHRRRGRVRHRGSCGAHCRVPAGAALGRAGGEAVSLRPTARWSSSSRPSPAARTARPALPDRCARRPRRDTRGASPRGGRARRCRGSSRTRWPARRAA